MSAKRWKRARTTPKHVAREIDGQQRRKLRPPWWINLAACLFGEGIRKRWVNRWAIQHLKALHDSVKIMTHGIMRGKK